MFGLIINAHCNISCVVALTSGQQECLISTASSGWLVDRTDIHWKHEINALHVDALLACIINENIIIVNSAQNCNLKMRCDRGISIYSETKTQMHINNLTWKESIHSAYNLGLVFLSSSCHWKSLTPSVLQVWRSDQNKLESSCPAKESWQVH